ncbi:carbohydrate ABC transporter permease [Hungatella hathewayi]|uniref:carbohydrate ABC transporter permease n=1 Tax=Hungatella hathewayi TaxID=154046 RepID=UPI00356341B4
MDGTNKKQRTLSLETRNTLVGMSFILPNFIGFAVLVLVPVAFSFLLSFMEWDGFTSIKFAGLENFSRIFGDRVFKAALVQTLEYSFFTVLLSMVAALGLALLVNQKLKGTTFFRSAIFFPYVASVVAIGAVWKAMFMKNGGPVNVALEAMGLAESYLPGWFSSTDWALLGTIIVSVWRNMGYFMIIYLAALQGIPNSLYEAATSDGASGWQKFRYITLPMLTPSHFFVFMMLTINSFKTFDLIFVLTEGGPGTSTTLLSMYIYNQAFSYMRYGMASAASMVLFLIIGTITVLMFRMEKKFNDFM